MRRRTFLTTTGGLIAAATIQSLLQPRARAATFTRIQAWAPNPSGSPVLVLEWRYIAGRITDKTGNTAEDYGFIVSISDQRAILGISAKQELLVQRQDFDGSTPFSESYAGNFTYASGTGAYTFQATSSPVSAIFQLDPNTQLYHLTLNSPQLNLPDVVLRPKGNLIAETGDGLLSAGQVQGIQVDSDYYACGRSFRRPARQPRLATTMIITGSRSPAPLTPGQCGSAPGGSKPLAGRFGM